MMANKIITQALRRAGYVKMTDPEPETAGQIGTVVAALIADNERLQRRNVELAARVRKLRAMLERMAARRWTLKL